MAIPFLLDVRNGVRELYAQHPVTKEFLYQDTQLEANLRDAVEILQPYEQELDVDYESAVKYLTRHFALLNFKEITSIDVPNAREGYAQKKKEEGYGATTWGQMFLKLIRNITDDFTAVDKKSITGLEFFS